MTDIPTTEQLNMRALFRRLEEVEKRLAKIAARLAKLERKP